MNSRKEQIEHFVRQHAGAVDWHPLAGDASFRRYIRLGHARGSYMLMDAPPEKEDVRPFVKVCGALTQAGYSAPTILASDEAAGLLLLEDLGDASFSRLLRAQPDAEVAYYEAAIELLASWHRGGIATQMLDLPTYDHALLLRELRLFSDWFLPQLLDGAALEEAQQSYLAIWQEILDAAPLAMDQFVHRDFHADNLMWLPAREGIRRVGLLDFQDAVAGDPAYDVLSLLEDARRDVSPALAAQMLRHYLDHSGADAGRFSVAYAVLAAQRNTKIVGIFTRLAARDGKAHYLDFLPRVWGHLQGDVAHPALSVLQAWLARHVPEVARGRLTIRKNAQALGQAA